MSQYERISQYRTNCNICIYILFIVSLSWMYTTSKSYSCLSGFTALQLRQVAGITLKPKKPPSLLLELACLPHFTINT